MPISFTCPHCGTKTDVAEQYAGQSGPCSACGRTITVPPLAGTPGYSPARRGIPTLAIVAVIVFGLIAMLVLCGGAFFLVGFRAVAVSPPPVPLSAAPYLPTDECADRLRQIGAAMHAYHAANGHFPPSHVADGDGKPQHSWRVLLLPFLGRQDLYDAYKFDEPWDSPANLAVARQMPEVYGCPEDPHAVDSQTSYAMLVGPGMISDGPTAHRIEDIHDGLPLTILIVEAAGSGIPWTEPRDLSAEEISFRVNDGTDDGIRSYHPSGAHVLLGDGTVLLRRPEQDPQQARSMSTIAGGELVNEAFD
ncbi:MAG: DUF1559 domain-containing protein [Pirellulales bacterium]|nr:DUF1559 domain-containing protein [Pirellulales bacterium]